MERWFDLHLYVANWGSRRLMIRLPKRLVDRRRLDAFLGEVDCATLSVSGENLIVDISRDEVDSRIGMMLGLARGFGSAPRRGSRR